MIYSRSAFINSQLKLNVCLRLSRSKIKSLWLIAVVLLAGCANSRYPGWQAVTIADSAENRPCLPKGAKEQCKDTQDDCDVWFKKRATIYGSNTVVRRSYGYAYTGRYFQCESGMPIYKSPAFVKDGYGSGSNTVTGQAFLTQVGGGVVTCAGNVVEMRPDTPYFNRVLDDQERGMLPDYDLNQEARDMIKTTQCDAQGNFEFHKIPSGNWVITTDVSWGVGYVGHNGFGFYNGINQQGGELKESVTIKEGEPNKFIISHPHSLQ